MHITSTTHTIVPEAPLTSLLEKLGQEPVYIKQVLDTLMN